MMPSSGELTTSATGISGNQDVMTSSSWGFVAAEAKKPSAKVWGGRGAQLT